MKKNDVIAHAALLLDGRWCLTEPLRLKEKEKGNDEGLQRLASAEA